MRPTLHIVDVQVIPFEVPYEHVFRFSTGSHASAEHVLVSVTASDGSTGHAEAIPRVAIYGETQASLTHMLRHGLAQRVVGTELWEPALRERLSRGIAHNHSAISSLELAIWQCRAENQHLPLRTLLGGGPDRLPVTWMTGLGTTADDVADEAGAAIERGHRRIKMKGGGDLAKDIATFQAIANAHPGVDVYIDGNQAYSWDDCLTLDRELSPFGLRWLEEPMDIRDPARALLGQRTSLRVLGDESVATSWDLMAQIRLGAIQAVSIKIGRSGVTEARQVAALARAHHLPVVIGTMGETSLGTFGAGDVAAHLAAELPNATTELMHHRVIADRITFEDPVIEDGYLELESSQPAIDPERLAKYALDRPVSRV